MIAALIVPAAPLAGAALLLAVRNPTVGGWIATAATATALALAATLPGQLGQDALTLVDPLSVMLVLSTATAGLAVTLQPSDLPTAGRDHPLRLAFLGFLLLALLSNHLAATWAALQAASIAAALLVGLPGTADAHMARWRQILLSGVGLAIALFGIVALALALGTDRPDLTWTTLAQAGPQLPGPLLNLAFTAMLAGLALSGLLPLVSVRSQAHGPAAAMLAVSTGTAAMMLIMRLRDLLARNPHAIEPGPPIMALGLVMLLVAALGLVGQRDTRRLFALAVAAQCGVALFAIGLGGPGATFAALLHIVLYTLSGSALAACLCPASRRHAPTLTGSLIAIAALPPFGLFASDVLILSETLRLHPGLALPLGAGIAITAASLFARLPGLIDPAAPSSRRLPMIPAWIALALSALLGFAMPHPVAAWIAAAASAPQ